MCTICDEKKLIQCKLIYKQLLKNFELLLSEKLFDFYKILKNYFEENKINLNEQILHCFNQKLKENFDKYYEECLGVYKKYNGFLISQLDIYENKIKQHFEYEVNLLLMLHK